MEAQCWDSPILRFTDHYNPGAQPFLWTATADFILHKIQRLCMAISGTEHLGLAVAIGCDPR